MPIQIKTENDEVVVIRATGKLMKEDYAHFNPQFDEITHEKGKLRVLFDITGFEGWEPTGIWEEAKFDLKRNTDIRRMAVIGDEKWHETLTAVFKPFAAGEVRYFHRGEINEARNWLLQRQPA